ncbi:MAG: aspartyl protease family protein, partial [Cyanobium sp. ELA507]
MARGPLISRLGGAVLVTLAVSQPAAAALIQLAGTPLSGGTVQGEAQLPLERAAGGDTPVLEFQAVGSAVGSALGRRRVRLLLDTGASSTMVTPALAERLGLATSPLPPGAFDLAGGGQGCGALAPRRTRLPDLRLSSTPGPSDQGSGGLVVRGVEALVMPVAALPKGVDGVLGAPSLRQLPILIDPTGSRLVLGRAALEIDPAKPALATPLTTPVTAWSASSIQGRREPLRIPLRWHHGVPLLSISSPSGPVQALADTGAEGLFLSPALASRLEPLGQAAPLRLVGFCGEQTVHRQRFFGLNLSPPQPP